MAQAQPPVFAAELALTAAQPSPPPIGRHLGVECDECGETPILGTRFKCTTRRNYDVCRKCWQENHKEDTTCFTACEASISYSQTRSMEPTNARRSIMVYSLATLAQELNRDDTIEDMTFYPQGLGVPADAQAAQLALANHTGLKSFHLYTRNGTREVDAVVQVIAQGLTQNQSVVSAGFAIASTTRLRYLAKETIQSLQQLMLTNKTIQYLFLKRPRDAMMDRPSLRSIKTELDDLESALFQALPHCSLHTFRYEAHRPVSDDNKKLAWKAMEQNDALVRICVHKFEHADSQLEVLMAEKKHQWIQRWAKLNAGNEHRLEVVQEIRNAESEDMIVPALFRLVRGQPAQLLQTY